MNPFAPDRTKLGFIGLGLMGRRIVQRLLRHGYQVIAYDQDRSRVEELIDSGASAAAKLAEITRSGQQTRKSVAQRLQSAVSAAFDEQRFSADSGSCRRYLGASASYPCRISGEHRGVRKRNRGRFFRGDSANGETRSLRCTDRSVAKRHRCREMKRMRAGRVYVIPTGFARIGCEAVCPSPD